MISSVFYEEHKPATPVTTIAAYSAVALIGVNVLAWVFAPSLGLDRLVAHAAVSFLTMAISFFAWRDLRHEEFIRVSHDSMVLGMKGRVFECDKAQTIITYRQRPYPAVITDQIEISAPCFRHPRRLRPELTGSARTFCETMSKAGWVILMPNCAQDHELKGG